MLTGIQWQRNADQRTNQYISSNFVILSFLWTSFGINFWRSRPSGGSMFSYTENRTFAWIISRRWARSKYWWLHRCRPPLSLTCLLCWGWWLGFSCRSHCLTNCLFLLRCARAAVSTACLFKTLFVVGRSSLVGSKTSICLSLAICSGSFVCGGCLSCHPPEVSQSLSFSSVLASAIVSMTEMNYSIVNSAWLFKWCVCAQPSLLPANQNQTMSWAFLSMSHW